MIWHIFKKDLRLSWKVAAVAALVQWLDAAMVVVIAVSGRPEGGQAKLEPLRQIVHVLAFIAVGIAAVAAVQNDHLPPPTGDWQIRPIRRIDMMLAKIVFFLVAIAGPIFVGNVAAGVWLGAGFLDAAYGSAVHAFASALWLGLFSLGLGAVTSNVLEAMMGGVACLLLFGVAFSTGNATRSAAYYGVSAEAVVGWMTAGLALGGLLAFASQYRKRKTRRARSISLGVFAFGSAISVLPSSTALALTEGVSQLSPAGWRFNLVQTRPPANADLSGLPQGINGDRDLSWLSFRVTGLRPGESLTAFPQESGAVVTDEAGTLTLGNPFIANSQGLVWLGIHGNQRRNLRHAVSVAATYSFSVVREAGRIPITAGGGTIRVPWLAWCASPNGAIGCFSVVPDSACFSPALGPDRPNPVSFYCRHNSSETLSWLWDWNAFPQNVFIRQNLLGKAPFVNVYERSGYLSGKLNLNVQPEDWLVPPDRD